MANEAQRLSGQEKDQQQKLGNMPSPTGITGRYGQAFGNYGSRGNSDDTQKLADERQRLADDLAQLQKQMREAERNLASNERPAAKKLRDALGDLETNDVENHIQHSADWLRRGVNANSPDDEKKIASSLQNLTDQLHQAQQALGDGQGQQGAETALDRIERLRNQLESMNTGERNGQRGQQGQPGQQDQSGQQGQSGQGNQNGQGSQAGGNRGGDNQPGSVGAYGPRGGFGATIGGGDRGGNRDYGGVDTGNNARTAATGRA